MVSRWLERLQGDANGLTEVTVSQEEEQQDEEEKKDEEEEGYFRKIASDLAGQWAPEWSCTHAIHHSTAVNI